MTLGAAPLPRRAVFRSPPRPVARAEAEDLHRYSDVSASGNPMRFFFLVVALALIAVGVAA